MNQENTQQRAFIERRHLHVSTFVLDVLPWPYIRAYVIRCCVLYCTLIPDMMSVGVKVHEILPIKHFLICDLYDFVEV